MATSGKQVTLSDGRLLGYAEYGDLKGSPEFYFPGFPSSRLEGRLMDPVARKLSVRVIAVDRPGIGLSTSKPGRTLLDWPDDVVELADSLGLARFAVIGHSSGGAYAAACAYKIPCRLTGAGMVCSVGPVDAPQAACGALRAARITYLLSKRVPKLLDLPYRLTARCVKQHVKKVIPLVNRFASGPDRTILARRRMRAMIIAAQCEAVRRGHDGVDQDLRILTSPWGFNLEAISMVVHLWHGEMDTVLPPAIGRFVARSIPRCRARFHRDEGHISVPLNWMEDIMTAMRSDANDVVLETGGVQIKAREAEGNV